MGRGEDRERGCEREGGESEMVGVSGVYEESEIEIYLRQYPQI